MRICGYCSVDLNKQDHKATCKHSDKCPGCEKLKKRIKDIENELSVSSGSIDINGHTMQDYRDGGL